MKTNEKNYGILCMKTRREDDGTGMAEVMKFIREHDIALPRKQNGPPLLHFFIIGNESAPLFFPLYFGV
jgi:hypothetical protein